MRERFRRVTCRSTIPAVRQLAWLMNEHQIGLRDLAARVGIHHATIERWFYQNGNPNWCNLVACFAAFDVQVLVRYGNQPIPELPEGE